MKYIVMALADKEEIFVFPRSVDHDRMVEACEAIRFGSERNWNRKYRDGEVVAAGFVDNGVCHGCSETLGISSRGDEDTKLLAWFERGVLGTEVQAAPSVPDRATMIERMKAAIEGECDGLAIDDNRAAAILDYVIAAAPSAPSVIWRCFHCDESFNDSAQAALHFGPTQHHEPACQVSVEQLREMESDLRRYREDDTDLHRQIYGMQVEHYDALRREEEKGYARGLVDAAAAPSVSADAIATLRDAVIDAADEWSRYVEADSAPRRCSEHIGMAFDAALKHAQQAVEPFQQRVQPWLMECFGPEIAADTQERNHRFLEESLELVQACGATQSEAHQLVDYVYGRPVGDKSQEVGGVMVTLAALCLAQGLDMHQAGETELARIWTKVEKIRAKQAAKPKHSPLPMAAEIDRDNLEGMAESMRMFRADMIKAGVIGDNVPPMFMTGAILGAIGKARAEALEEAARACEQNYTGLGGPPDDPHPDAILHNGCVHDCATDIRALKSQQPVHSLSKGTSHD